MQSGIILKRGRPLKPRTLESYRGIIKQHVKPLLGDANIKSLAHDDIERFVLNVKSGKTKKTFQTKSGGISHVTGGESIAKNAIVTLSAIFNYAIRKGYIDKNPCTLVDRPAPKARTRYLNEEEYRSLGECFKALDNQNGFATAINVLKLVALTGCRKNEILNLKRSEVDKVGRSIRFEDTKTGAQIRPCGSSAFEIIQRQLTTHDSAWVFPSQRREGPIDNIRKPMAKIMKQVELEDVTLHTFRHSFATMAHMLNYSELTIAGLLGHRAGSVTARYAHHVDHALADAADRVSNHINSLLLGIEEETNIIPFIQK